MGSDLNALREGCSLSSRTQICRCRKAFKMLGLPEKIDEERQQVRFERKGIRLGLDLIAASHMHVKFLLWFVDPIGT
jgi:hypothetical protein